MDKSKRSRREGKPNQSSSNEEPKSSLASASRGDRFWKDKPGVVPTGDQDARGRRAHICGVAELKARRRQQSPAPFVDSNHELKRIESEFQRAGVILEDIEHHIPALCSLQVEYEYRATRARNDGNYDAEDRARQRILTIRELKARYISGNLSTPATPPDGLPVKPQQVSAQHKPKGLMQEEAILNAIREAGYDPKALPKHVPGKSGVKAQIRAIVLQNPALFTTNSFDKAWERLRVGDIGEAK